MATQGLVTIKSHGKVVMKIVAGCNGMKAPILARRLRKGGKLPSLKEVYDLAEELGFGSSQCLVVIDETQELYKGEDVTSPRYRETFDQPRFNPRWEQGIADHIIVVDL